MLLALIIVMLFGAVVLIVSQVMPLFLERASNLSEKRVRDAEAKLDDMFVIVPREKLILIYAVSPVIGAFIGYFIAQNFILAGAGAAIGLILPKVVLNNLAAKRKKNFQNQLLDGIMVLSSCLKGGLSFLQAIEVLVEEAPAPLSQEFGLMLRENKMGITLEESLKRMNTRMKVEDLSFLVNALLVARETGGDLTKVLSRLATTIRDNRKIKENIKTLTMQGRMQGVLMSILPVVFIFFVLSTNRHHFDIMFASDQGKMLIGLAIGLQIIGMILIKKFSTIKI